MDSHIDSYIVPYIQITPNYQDIISSITLSNRIGKIKDEINIPKLIESNKLLKNDDFVNFIKSTNYTFIPLPGYYDDDVKNIFDIYGNMYTEKFDDIELTIKIYFYKIKNIELLTKKCITHFKLIFQYDYFVKNNILDAQWHSYRLTLFNKDIEKKKFYNLEYHTPKYCKTKLFNHQINNISCMLDIYRNPHIIKFNGNLIRNYDNGIIYDFVKNTFIQDSEITDNYIKSGMILDEPGTGKTLQFILFLLECNNNSLILVPNNDIKYIWFNEFKKHIDFDITSSKIQILTFLELDELIQYDSHTLNKYDIIGIDEIHILYSNTKNLNLFEKIVNSNIKSRWGITGTPFVNDMSLFNIIKFLFGTGFSNERIANIPSLQNSLIKLFLKNLKINMIDDYVWPELIINDVFIKLDIVQENIYKTELKTTHNIKNLRKLVSDIQLMFNNNIKTPTELKLFALSHYKKNYQNELEKLDELKNQYTNIINNEKNFEQVEFIKRIKHFKYLITTQDDVVKKHNIAFEYFLSSIDNISNILKNKEIDDNCSICLNDFTPPIKYLKNCGHYFCETCINYIIPYTVFEINCPICRQVSTKYDIITVNEISEINNSPKIHEILKIIESTDDKFIIFTQFDILTKIYETLNKYNIESALYSDYKKGNIDVKVLLLSSEQNAEGINLNMFDKLIIFEPFEDHMYCKEIEKQLIGRIHRIGRIKPVDVFRLITENTIEQEIYYK